MRESESEERNVHIDVGDTSSMGARDITRNIRVVATRTTRSSRTSQRLALLPLSWSCTSKRHRTLLRHDQSRTSSVSRMVARARPFRCCVRRTSASGRLDDAKVVAVLRQAVEGALCVVPTPSDRQPTNQRANKPSKIDLAVRYLRHIALEVRQIESDGRQRRRHERHEQHDENHT